MVLNNGNASLYDQPCTLLKVVQVQDLCPANQQLGLWKPYRAVFSCGEVGDIHTLPWFPEGLITKAWWWRPPGYAHTDTQWSCGQINVLQRVI